MIELKRITFLKKQIKKLSDKAIKTIVTADLLTSYKDELQRLEFVVMFEDLEG